MMSTIHERLLQICEYKGINLRQLSIMCDIPYNSLYTSVKRKSDIGVSTISKISLSLPDISCKWLLQGNCDMIEKQIDNDNVNVGNCKYMIDRIEYLSGKVATLQYIIDSSRSNSNNK